MLPNEAPPAVGGDVMSSRRAWLLRLGVVGALVGGLVYAIVAWPSSSTTGPAASTPTSTTSAAAVAARVYQTILPSLVLVDTQRVPAAVGGPEALGSGVIVNTAGQILTAYHVVRDASAIEVTFADGTKSAATVAAANPDHDTAVLQPDHGPSVIVPAVLGSDRNVRVGDEAFSAGNPLGLTASFTAGVISGLDRSVPVEGGSGELQGVIQFDAAVNPGSSGGPLLNRQGQVIGIVTGLANPTSQDVFIGVGFAVPIRAAGGGTTPQQ